MPHDNRVLGGRAPILGALRVLMRRRYLLFALVAREVRDCYAGSLFGVLWAVLQPVAFIAILIAVFGFALGGKFGADGIDYPGYVVAGLLPWMAISAGLQAAARSIRAHASLVKQIDFPLEVLPVKTVLAQTVGQLVGFVLLVAYLAVRNRALPATLPLVVPAFALQVMLTVGLGWFIAALAAYLRDIEHALPTLLMLNMYLLPIFFPPGTAPQVLRAAIDYNPFAPIVLMFQDTLIYGELRHPVAWAMATVMALIAFELGFRFFSRTRGGFGDLV